ncbi:NEK1 [Symbiodinium microadriaticum]|nr:NEK1 [Symbiodinium microadriaticum]
MLQRLWQVSKGACGESVDSSGSRQVELADWRGRVRARVFTQNGEPTRVHIINLHGKEDVYTQSCFGLEVCSSTAQRFQCTRQQCLLLLADWSAGQRAIIKQSLQEQSLLGFVGDLQDLPKIGAAPRAFTTHASSDTSLGSLLPYRKCCSKENCGRQNITSVCLLTIAHAREDSWSLAQRTLLAFAVSAKEPGACAPQDLEEMSFDPLLAHLETQIAEVRFNRDAVAEGKKRQSCGPPHRCTPGARVEERASPQPCRHGLTSQSDTANAFHDCGSTDYIKPIATPMGHTPRLLSGW